MVVRIIALALLVLSGTSYLRDPSCPLWFQAVINHEGHEITPREPQHLRDLADRAGVLIGAAVRANRLSEAAYAAALGREFNLLEPEDAMKWNVLHPAPETFDFSAADRIVGFASEHRMKVRGHVLVWHQALPDWINKAGVTPDELARTLQRHVQTVVSHFRGKVFAWDVANEAFDELRLGTLRSTLWYDRPGIGLAGEGTAYLERCFRWAHEADPQALLFYNEAGAEVVNAKSDAIYAMARDFQRRKVPLHGLGLQMHLSSLHPDLESISKNIARFTTLGIQVHITELDVAIPVDANEKTSEEDLQRQAEVYRDVVTVCLAHPRCTAIQMWGFTDKYSWVGSHTKGTKGAALPFDREYHPKAAYKALLEALRKGRR